MNAVYFEFFFFSYLCKSMSGFLLLLLYHFRLPGVDKYAINILLAGALFAKPFETDIFSWPRGAMCYVFGRND